jgi:pimeloyl-ACP methyl ester carboxylesterase
MMKRGKVMGHLVRENENRIYYEDHGSGERAIVLVHGWGMGVRVWDHVVPAMRAAGFRVVLFDQRGCGESDKDFADLSITSIASDLVALVDSLALETVVLNGWSLGGAVVVEAAASLGERCAGLVLTCGATPVYVQKPDFPYGGTEEDMAATLGALTADRVNFLHGLRKTLVPTSSTGYGRFFCKRHRWPVRHWASWPNSTSGRCCLGCECRSCPLSAAKMVLSRHPSAGGSVTITRTPG